MKSPVGGFQSTERACAPRKMAEFYSDKFAFAQATNTPVGCLSDRTVLRKQNGGVSLRQVPICPLYPLRRPMCWFWNALLTTMAIPHYFAGRHPQPAYPHIRYSSNRRGCSNNRTCGAKVPDHMVRPGCPPAYRYPGPDTTAGTPHHSDNRGQPDLVADDSFCHFGSSPQTFIDFIFYSVGSVSAVTVSPSSFALRRSLPHSGVKK